MSGEVPGSTPSAPARESRRLLDAVLGSTFFVRFAFGLTVSIFASYIVGRSDGIDATAVGTVGLISAMAPIGEFSTVLLSGTAADRFGRFPVLLIGMGAAAGLFAAVSITRDPLALAVLNLGFGVASGAILASSLAVVADQADRSRTGYEMGRFDAMNLLGWIVGFAVGFGLLGTLDNPGLAWVFRAGANLLAAGVALAAQLARRHREKGLNPRFDHGAIYRAVSRRSVLLFSLPWLVIYLLLGPGFFFLGGASQGLGVPPLDLAAVIGGGGALLLLTQPYFGRLADRHGRMRLMLVGTVGFVGVLACAAVLQHVGPVPWLLVALGVSALVGLAYGPAALAALADLSQMVTRATTMAIYTLTISLGMFVGLGLSTSLYSTFGAIGLDGFFAAIGVALVGLTLARRRDLALGREVVGA